MKKKSLITGFILFAGLLAFLFVADYYTINFVHEDPHHVPNPLLFLWLAIILFFGKIAAGIIERLKKPTVLGELLVGLLLGNVAMIGITFLEPIKTTPVINFLAQLGAVILYFQAGLASQLDNVRKSWKQALSIALLGLGFSFTIYTLLLPFIFPEQSQLVYFFVAYALSPTGTGVAARVLQDIGKIQHSDAQLVLSTGAIDNIISYIVLAMFTAVISSGSINPAYSLSILGKVLVFIIGIFFFCIYLLPRLSQFIAQVYSGRALKFGFSFSIALCAAFLAQSIGISPIIGAFTAGLAINPKYFDFFKPAILANKAEQSAIKISKKEKKPDSAQNKDLEEMYTTPAFLLVTIFFVVSGMAVNLREIANPLFLFYGIILLVAAVASKFFAVFVVRRDFKNILAAGLVPRVTTTLVFATVGKSLGLLPINIYSMIILTVILTAFASPILISNFANNTNQS
jgi:Kef-type K+ transport system membrane component KefB